MVGFEMVEVVTGCGFWDAYYEKGSAYLDPDGMQEARIAGKRLVGGPDLGFRNKAMFKDAFPGKDDRAHIFTTLSATQ